MEDHFKELYELTEQIHYEFNKKHAEFLKQVLANAGIPEEDYKKVTRYVPDYATNFYYLGYAGLKMGRIDLDFENGKITFTPDKDLGGEAVLNGKINF